MVLFWSKQEFENHALQLTHVFLRSSLQLHHTWEGKDLRCHSRSSSPIFPVSELNEYNIPVAVGVCDEEVRPILPSCLAISCNILLPSSKIDLGTHTSPPSLPLFSHRTRNSFAFFQSPFSHSSFSAPFPLLAVYRENKEASFPLGKKPSCSCDFPTNPPQ